MIKHIFKLMKTDSYKRFLNSAVYQDLLDVCKVKLWPLVDPETTLPSLHKTCWQKIVNTNCWHHEHLLQLRFYWHIHCTVAPNTASPNFVASVSPLCCNYNPFFMIIYSAFWLKPLTLNLVTRWSKKVTNNLVTMSLLIIFWVVDYFWLLQYFICQKYSMKLRFMPLLKRKKSDIGVCLIFIRQKIIESQNLCANIGRFMVDASLFWSKSLKLTRK